MAGENMINLGINEDMVKPILEKQIQAAILQNIGDIPDMLRKMVSATLNTKVNSNGVRDSSSYNNKYDFMEVLTTKAIQDASKEAIREFVEEKKEELKKVLRLEMEKEENKSAIVKAFVDSAVQSFDYKWRFDCRVNLKAEEN